MRIDPARGLWVRAPTPLGDFLAAEPALRALADAFAESGHAQALTITAPNRMAELVAPRFRGARSLPSEIPEPELVARVRGHGAALLLAGSFRSAWTAARARIPIRVGLARDGRGWLLTDAIRPALERGATPLHRGVRGRAPRTLPRPGAATYTELLGALGIAVRDPRPRLAARPEVARTMGEQLAGCGLDPGRPFLTASIGGAGGAVAKSPPPSVWVRLLGRLHRELGWPLLLAPGLGDESVAREVRDGLPRGATTLLDPERAPDLEELTALFGRSAAVLTGDTGPRHLARAVGTPAVVLVGSTDPRHTALRPSAEQVLRGELPCAPCHRAICPRPTGPEPSGVDRECLVAIDPERVLEALVQLL